MAIRSLLIPLVVMHSEDSSAVAIVHARPAGVQPMYATIVQDRLGDIMAYSTPQYSKTEINKAGQIFAAGSTVDQSGFPTSSDREWASQVLSNWRACHSYPINTFKATLHNKLKAEDIGDAIVGQRLKRTPSIIDKLRRYPSMRLAQMQDIGGLRAVVSTLAQVKHLQDSYKTKRLKHDLLGEKDYIENPKPSGYRSVHLVFRYQSDHPISQAYNGLAVELQIRTKLQHAWATAVETMGTFLGQSLKASRGEQEWLKFFEVVSTAFTILEESPSVPGFESLSKKDVFQKVADAAESLHVIHILSGFSAVLNSDIIAGKSFYHLITLDSEKKAVTVSSYGRDEHGRAMIAYAEAEDKAKDTGGRVDVVLVSAGPLARLKRAFPNYFLDTHDFVSKVDRIIADV
jgi:ppGpp synthetase/RelA/SpoT-type nucleotidyltranferase